jgi:hypothetical protein
MDSFRKALLLPEKGTQGGDEVKKTPYNSDPAQSPADIVKLHATEILSALTG